MLLSLSPRFIFVHVIKTGGMAIERALARHNLLGRFDLLTTSQAEAARGLAELGVSPRLLDLDRHASARVIRATLGPALFDGCFRFAFVRNPWDLLVSLYHYNLQNAGAEGHAEAARYADFRGYALAAAARPGGLFAQLDMILGEDLRPIVNFVGRFERLQADFDFVCDRLGLARAVLERVNASRHRPWPAYYDRASFAAVAAAAAPEIKAFGYPDRPEAYGIG